LKRLLFLLFLLTNLPLFSQQAIEHSVKIDPQDNIWVADKGSDMVINGSTKLPARQKTNCTSPSC
jgi:hypothetical protein